VRGSRPIQGILDENGEVDLRNLRREATIPSQRHRSSSASASDDFPLAGARETAPGQVAETCAPWNPTQASVEGPDPEAQGPCFSQWIWAYYSNSGAWSDGLCVGLQNMSSLAVLVCPPLWLRRLYLTLQRAAPLDVRILGSGCSVTRDAACKVAAAAFALLILCCGFGVGLFTWVFVRMGREHPAEAAAALSFLPLSLLLGAFLWAKLLVAVGEKYNITQVQRWPLCFLLKATGCLCAMNVRVGRHVDRAQGFLKPSRAVRDMVNMASSMGYAQVGGGSRQAEADQRHGWLHVV